MEIFDNSYFVVALILVPYIVMFGWKAFRYSVGIMAICVILDASTRVTKGVFDIHQAIYSSGILTLIGG